jgi:hypothetical protein
VSGRPLDVADLIHERGRLPVPVWEKLQSTRWNRAVAAALGLLAVVVVVGIVSLVSGGDDPAPADGGPTGVASPIDPNSPRPPDNPTLAPNDDPAADSAYGVEAQKLLDELRGHNVPFTDADANVLVDIGDKNVARGIPDLAANDPEISNQIAVTFPQYTEQQRTDVVRCLAEYVELTIAKNRGTVPPDSDDHHN